MSESCNVAAISHATASPASASTTAFVSSSTKSGTPSVRVTTASTISSRKAAPGATRPTISRACLLLSRLSVSCAWCARSGHGSRNSGRAVYINSTAAVAPCSTKSPSSSSVEGSTQCTSSTTSTTGCTRAKPTCGERCEDLSPLLLGREAEWRVALGHWQAQYRRHERHGVARVHPGQVERAFEPFQTLVRGLVAAPGEELLQHVDHWEERRVLVIRRPDALDPRVALARKILLQLLDQP